MPRSDARCQPIPTSLHDSFIVASFTSPAARRLWSDKRRATELPCERRVPVGRLHAEQPIRRASADAEPIRPAKCRPTAIRFERSDRAAYRLRLAT